MRTSHFTSSSMLRAVVMSNVEGPQDWLACSNSSITLSSWWPLTALKATTIASSIVGWMKLNLVAIDNLDSSSAQSFIASPAPGNQSICSNNLHQFGCIIASSGLTAPLVAKNSKLLLSIWAVATSLEFSWTSFSSPIALSFPVTAAPIQCSFGAHNSIGSSQDCLDMKATCSTLCWQTSIGLVSMSFRSNTGWCFGTVHHNVVPQWCCV